MRVLRLDLSRSVSSVRDQRRGGLFRGESVEMRATVSNFLDGSHHVESWCDEVLQESKARGVEKSPRGARPTGDRSRLGRSPGRCAREAGGSI